MSRANEIAMKYLAGVHGALRKQNTAKLKPGFKNTEAVDPDDMDDNSELGDDDISSLLESTTSAENEMGDDFTGDGKDVGDKGENASDDDDQSTEGGDPRGAMFGDRKSTASVDQSTEGRDPKSPIFKKKPNFR